MTDDTAPVGMAEDTLAAPTLNAAQQAERQGKPGEAAVLRHEAERLLLAVQHGPILRAGAARTPERA
jgi:hypothetical protein